MVGNCGGKKKLMKPYQQCFPKENKRDPLTQIYSTFQANHRKFKKARGLNRRL